MPSVGLGTWQYDPGVVGQAVEIAIKRATGILIVLEFIKMRRIGEVLKRLFKMVLSRGKSSLLHPKLWNTDHAPEAVAVAINKTLEDLLLDYVDLYLMHWPVSMKPGSVDFKPENLMPTNIPSTWQAMEKLYDSGKAKAIDVSNFSTKKLGDLLQVARVPPAVNQVECILHGNKPNCESCVNPRSASFCTTWLKSDVLKLPVVISVTEKLGKTPAQVCLRWGIQMGQCVLPKSTNEAKIKENLDVLDWSIPDDLFAKFSEIPQARLLRGTSFVHETHGQYRTLEELWDGEL